LKREYRDYDTQYIEFKHKYFNRLYLEHLWMEPIYIDFTQYSDFEQLPTVWTEKKRKNR
jgi:hypothetical protein